MVIVLKVRKPNFTSEYWNKRKYNERKAINTVVTLSDTFLKTESTITAGLNIVMNSSTTKMH